MNAILVTGGAGFIGTNFIYYMQNKYPNLDIVCIDKLTYAGNLKNLKQALEKPNFKFVHGDITDVNLLDSVFRGTSFNAVVNFAAESHVDRSIDSPAAFIETNYNGVFCLLEMAKKYSSGRFHQVSTDEVYGDLPIDSKETFYEISMLKPSSPYSASKAAADLLVLAYNRTYGLDVTISRCTNNFGKYQYPEKLIPVVITKAKNNENIPLYGSGSNIRDWIHVDDHCSAIDTIVRTGISGEVYNVGSNNEISNIDLIQNILNVLQKPISLIMSVIDRTGHDQKYSVDTSKLKNLGWSDSGLFQQKLEETIKWYLDTL